MEENNQLLNTIIRGIQEKKGRKIAVLDLRNLIGAVCQYFIVCEGNTPTQVDAIVESVADIVREELHEKPVKVVGRENSIWVAMDYTDCMVHVFVPDYRRFYDIERLWSDAKTTTIPDED